MFFGGSSRAGAGGTSRTNGSTSSVWTARGTRAVRVERPPSAVLMRVLVAASDVFRWLVAHKGGRNFVHYEVTSSVWTARGTRVVRVERPPSTVLMRVEIAASDVFPRLVARRGGRNFAH